MDGGQNDVITRFRPTPDRGRDLRAAFGRFATGVTVVTTRTPGGPVGMTANSFSSVSLDPPLTLWSVDRNSERFAVFSTAERYAIHVLDAGQAALSNGFAKSPNHFPQVAWHDGADGVPALEGVLARFDCRLAAAHPAGDHLVLIGEVLEVEFRDGLPLVFACGRYGGVTAD